MSDDASQRRAARESWPARVYRLGEEPGDDLSATTTAAERVEMVWELSARMWELSGKLVPSYDRAHIPVKVIRLA